MILLFFLFIVIVATDLTTNSHCSLAPKLQTPFSTGLCYSVEPNSALVYCKALRNVLLVTGAYASAHATTRKELWYIVPDDVLINNKATSHVFLTDQYSRSRSTPIVFRQMPCRHAAREYSRMRLQRSAAALPFIAAATLRLSFVTNLYHFLINGLASLSPFDRQMTWITNHFMQNGSFYAFARLLLGHMDIKWWGMYKYERQSLFQAVGRVHVDSHYALFINASMPSKIDDVIMIKELELGDSWDVSLFQRRLLTTPLSFRSMRLRRLRIHVLRVFNETIQEIRRERHDSIIAFFSSVFENEEGANALIHNRRCMRVANVNSTTQVTSYLCFPLTQATSNKTTANYIEQCTAQAIDGNQHALVVLRPKPLVGNGQRARRTRVIENPNDLFESIFKNIAWNGCFLVTSVDFTRISLLEQIELINDANLYVSVHGAALSLAVFHSTQLNGILELMPYGGERFAKDFYRDEIFEELGLRSCAVSAAAICPARFSISSRRFGLLKHEIGDFLPPKPVLLDPIEYFTNVSLTHKEALQRFSTLHVLEQYRGVWLNNDIVVNQTSIGNCVIELTKTGRSDSSRVRRHSGRSSQAQKQSSGSCHTALLGTYDWALNATVAELRTSDLFDAVQILRRFEHASTFTCVLKHVSFMISGTTTTATTTLQWHSSYNGGDEAEDDNVRVVAHANDFWRRQRFSPLTTKLFVVANEIECNSNVCNCSIVKKRVASLIYVMLDDKQWQQQQQPKVNVLNEIVTQSLIAIVEEEQEGGEKQHGVNVWQLLATNNIGELRRRLKAMSVLLNDALASINDVTRLKSIFKEVLLTSSMQTQSGTSDACEQSSLVIEAERARIGYSLRHQSPHYFPDIRFFLTRCSLSILNIT